MPPDIYKPELWGNFFVMLGDGVAALVGLIFVALTFKPEGIKDTTHKYRSTNTLSGLTAVFIGCGLVLMPNQNHIAIGIELLIIALIGATIFLHGFYQAFKSKKPPSKIRLVIGTCLYIAEILGAVMLIAGSLLGLYIAAAAIVINVAFMISASWLLVVGEYGD